MTNCTICIALVPLFYYEHKNNDLCVSEAGQSLGCVTCEIVTELDLCTTEHSTGPKTPRCTVVYVKGCLLICIYSLENEQYGLDLTSSGPSFG